eukprot:643853-Pyramimonas_sp.AAC.1
MRQSFVARYQLGAPLQGVPPRAPAQGVGLVAGVLACLLVRRAAQWDRQRVARQLWLDPKTTTMVEYALAFRLFHEA